MDFFTRGRIIVISISALMIGLVVWMLALRPKQTMSALAPEHGSFYAEIDRPLDMLKNVQKGIRLYSNPGLTVFAEWQEELVYIQDLLQNEPSIRNYLQSATIGISGHVLTGKEAGYIFYFPLNAAEQEKVFSLLKRYYGKNPGYSYHERQYLNTNIAEITFKVSGKSFSMAKANGTLFGSFSGFLVEEVIRKSGIIFKPNFAEKLKRDHRHSGIASKPLRLYLNPSRLPDFFYQYLSPNLHGLKLLGSLGDAMAFGFSQPAGLDWVTEGYMINENPNEKGQHQIPLQKDLVKYIPGSKAFTFQVSLSGLLNLFPGKKPLENPSDNPILKALHHEFLMAFLEGETLKKYDRLVVFKIKNQQLLDDWLKSQELETGGDHYTEKFGRVEIRQHSNPRLGSILAGNLMADWTPLFFARDENQLILSDDMELLKRSLLEKNKPHSQNQSLLHPSFIQWKADVVKSIPFLADHSTGIFKNNFQEWIPILKGVQEISLMDNGEEENPGLTLNLQLKVPSASDISWQIKKEKWLDTNAISPMIRLEWKNQNRMFWVVQDQQYQTYFLDQNLSLLGKVKMFGPWTNRPQLLDIPNAKWPAVLFATSRSIRIFSLDGREVFPSPILLPDTMGAIEQCRAIDYDQNGQYRIMATSRYGDVWMADMKKEFLPPWNPWHYETPMAMAPKHIRIGDRDLIILLDNRGKLMIVNRKGEMQPGFPIELAGRSNQPVYLEPGLDLKTSYIYVLSEIGQVEKVNFEGTSLSKIQLFRPEKDTRFQFCLDQRQKTFVIARITNQSITVFDQSYKPIFETKIAGGNGLVQHFHYGASNKIFSVLDKNTSQLFLFNETGQLLNQEPIACDHGIDVFPEEQGEGFLFMGAKGKKIMKINFLKD